jgi:hypothetical protein
LGGNRRDSFYCLYELFNSSRIKKEMKPDERAKSILNNAFYFTGNKNLAKELALWICELIGETKPKIDDKIYWKLVAENIYLL